MGIEDEIRNGNTILGNSRQNTEINAALRLFGIDEEVYSGGELLLKTFLEKTREREKRYSERLFSTKRMREIAEEIKPLYAKLRKIGKRVFSDDMERGLKLGFKTRYPRHIPEYTTVLEQFYSGLDDDVRSGLLKYRIDSLFLEKLFELYEELKRAMANRMLKEGELQNATVEKDKAQKECLKWKNEFLFVAKLALEEKPQLLESLGVKVRS